jgi:hypothetical protein
MNPQQRTILIAVAAAIVSFGIGAIWQYTRASAFENRLEQTERDLTFQQLEATLGAATIEAQRGSYEIARQLISDFFGGLQTSYQSADAGRQQPFSEILAQRDAMITSLSRSDPQSGSMLAQLFVRYRLAMGEPVGPESGTTSPPPPPMTTTTM